MPSIKELLHRRTDLSTFVVHFTRDYGTPTTGARDNLLSCRIEARTVYRMGKELAERFLEVAATQRVVCLTETPLEHAWMMCSEIDERREVQPSGHGVAFTRAFARRRGANPVWYLDITPRPSPSWLTNPINQMVAEAEQQATPDGATTPDLYRLARMPILRLTPFIEQMGPTQGGERCKEFWWEREWRRVGDMDFTAQDIVVVFAPESDHPTVRQRLAGCEHHHDKMPALVDAHWVLNA